MTNRQITISIGTSRRATRWTATPLWWSEFVERLRVPARSTETLQAYLALSKGKQDDLKDVGGFVGGTLNGGRRKASAVLQRDLITLDLDNIPPEGTADALKQIQSTGVQCVVYSTRKHEPAKPRLRAVFLLAEPCTADEYEPIARKLAEDVGIELCDPTTFEASRLMYWPSCCVDSQYVYQGIDGGPLDGPAVLKLYKDWKNVNEWPRVPGEERKIRHADKLGDPRAKEGIVGAFCRQYDIYRALEEILPGVYLPTELQDRFTYSGGSTAGGAVVYDNGLFLYSHHATDPCSGREVNAFDLVRLHMFGDQDDECAPNTPAPSLPSYKRMCSYALTIPTVSLDLLQHKTAKAAEDFQPDSTGAEDDSWKALLDISKQTGAIQKTIKNVSLILDNDPKINKGIVFEEFSQRLYVVGNLPWEPWKGARRVWCDRDNDELMGYMEHPYGITGEQKIYHGLGIHQNRHKINEVQQYLGSLAWDGVCRLDRLFVDYLGAEDTPYVRAVTRKSFCAAVARVYHPGMQYDYVPILRGSQGLGKSTVLRVMAGPWYCDSLESFEGKEAAELLQGMWIIELGELTALTRSEAAAAKHFITKKDDQFRKPWGREVGVYPRRCVFFGTTNAQEYLRDTTGNRRFWPIDCDEPRRTKSPWADLPGERDQLWAEAVTRWRLCAEPLYLPPELEAVAKVQQREHMETDDRAGLVAEFLERPLPKDWYDEKKWPIENRRAYWSGEFGTPRADGAEVMPRQTVAPIEVWVECFGRDKAAFNKRESADINRILSILPGWTPHGSNFRNGSFGVTRGFVKEAAKA